MICSSCGQENSWDAKICSGCGQPLNAVPGPEQTGTEAATVAYSDAAASNPNATLNPTGSSPEPNMGTPSYMPPGLQEPVQGPPSYGVDMGKQIPSGAAYYPSPGAMKPVRDYMSWSIIVTIISAISCNLLAAGLGIPAIVFIAGA